MEEFEKILSDHPFFRGMNERLIKLLVGCATESSYKAGDYIYKEGDDANQFLLIQRGIVAIEIFVPNRGSITIQTIGDGDILGWSWLFPPYTRRFDARAIEHTTAIELDGVCLRGKVQNDFELGYELLSRFSRIVVERLQATRLQLLDLYGPNYR